MVQRKKDGVRDAICAAAFRLFSEQGYSATSLPQIAREAGISTANVYVYFGSKLEVLFSVYAPWLRERLDRLDGTLARIEDPRRRLERLLLALWRDLPRESNGFANNVMQAISTSAPDGEYSPALREFFQRRVAAWVQRCTAGSDRQADRIASVLLMAFDGFAMNARLKRGVACTPAMATIMSAALLDLRPPSAGTVQAPPASTRLIRQDEVITPRT
jgi:AcrR family transcriptional regulator